MRAGGNRLGEVAGIADTAIGDQRHAGAFERRSHVGHGSDLWHAHAGHDARGADGTWPDAHLDAVRTGIDQSLGSLGVTMLPPITCNLRVLLLDRTTVEHALGVTVGGVHDEEIHAGFDQRPHPLICIAALPTAAPTRSRPGRPCRRRDSPWPSGNPWR